MMMLGHKEQFTIKTFNKVFFLECHDAIVLWKKIDVETMLFYQLPTQGLSSVNTFVLPREKKNV